MTTSDSNPDATTPVPLDLPPLLEEPAAPAAPARPRRRAVVAEDEALIRMDVVETLREAGFDVVGEAETGVEAVAKYQELRPDLVTMDIVMPDMGGIDAVREITKLDPQARVLMCSAMGQQALVVEALQAGAKDFVVKPFQPSRVLEAVERILN